MGRLGLLAGDWEGFWYRPGSLSGGQKPQRPPRSPRSPYFVLSRRARGRRASEGSGAITPSVVRVTGANVSTPRSLELTPVGGTSHLPIERRRAQMAKARAAWPPIAQRRANGGRHWAERYRALSPEERARIIMRCVLGWYRWDARRRGLPDPIPYTYEAVVGDDGKVAPKLRTLRPMTNAEIEAL
jgi:hypothetical protein